MEPAVLRIDAGCAVGANGVTHIIEAGLRQRPKILGALEADPRDQLVGVGAEARQHEAGIAARRVAGEAAGLQHHDGPAAARHFPRRGQAREPAADDADIDVEIERQLRARRRVRLSSRRTNYCRRPRVAIVVTHQDGIRLLPPNAAAVRQAVHRPHDYVGFGVLARTRHFSRESDITAMRRLMLLRHAKTERAEPGERDRDRKLMKRGRNDAPVIGAYMAHHDLVPDLALVSPAVARAGNLGARCCHASPKTPKMATDDRIYNADTAQLADVVRETRAAKSLLLVGHNPGFHELAVQLIASGDVDLRESAQGRPADIGPRRHRSADR